MATNNKRVPLSQLPEETSPSGFWMFGSKMVNGVLVSVKFAYENFISLFNVTQEKGQSLELAVSQKAWTDDSKTKADKVNDTGDQVVYAPDGKIASSTGVFNANIESGSDSLTFDQAIGYVPVSLRKRGLLLRYTEGESGGFTAWETPTAYILKNTTWGGSGIGTVSTSNVDILKDYPIVPNRQYKIKGTNLYNANGWVLRARSVKVANTAFETTIDDDNLLNEHSFTSGADQNFLSMFLRQPSQTVNVSITNSVQICRSIGDGTAEPKIYTYEFYGNDWSDINSWREVVIAPDDDSFLTEEQANELYLSKRISPEEIEYAGTATQTVAVFIPVSLKPGHKYKVTYKSAFTGIISRSSSLNDTGTITYAESWGNLPSTNFSNGFSEEFDITGEANFLRLNYFEMSSSNKAITVTIEDVTEISSEDILTKDQAKKLYTPLSGEETITNIYVSASGDDTKDGLTEANAVKTIEKATQLAGARAENVVNIIISYGTYRIENTVTVPAGKTINYKGIGQVEIKGGKIFSGWAATSDSNVYKINIGALRPLQVFINNEIILPASTERISLDNPYNGMVAGGVTDVTGPSLGKQQKITLSAADIANLALNDNYKNGWIVHTREWKQRKLKIISIDTAANTITTKCLQYYITPEIGITVEGVQWILNGNPLVFENFNFDFVTGNKGYTTFREGTYYLDASGDLYYKLKAGEDIANLVLSVPYTTMLFDIQGKASFNNLKISESDYNYFDGSYGEFPNIFSTDNQAGMLLNSAIEVFGSSDFTDCEFYHLAQPAIGYRGTSRNSKVYNCHFHDTGACAVKIGEWNTKTPVEGQVPEGIIVDNCIVRNAGNLSNMAAAIVVTFAIDCRITHCDISRQFYTGISLGYEWDSMDAKQQYRNCYVGYNKIYDLFRSYALHDGAGIYTLGATQGLIIEYNIIHDIKGYTDKVWGIYNDQSSRSVVSRNNIIYDCTGAHLANANGYNTLVNNIFAYCGVMGKVIGQKGPNTFVNNIFYLTTGALFSGTVPNLNNNMYYKEGGTMSAPSQDANPVVNLDPHFADPQNRDFEITDTGNTDKIKFEPVDIENIGVTGKMRKKITGN